MLPALHTARLRNQHLTASRTPTASTTGSFLSAAFVGGATRCYQLGAANMNATDAVAAAANVSELLVTGAGRIECRIDLSGQVAQFVLHVDAAGQDAQ